MTISESDKPRSLNELVNLETYQGMSDAEIDILIAYKVDMELRKRIAEGNKTANIVQMESLIQQNERSSQDAMTVLKSILEKPMQLKSVGDV